MSVKSIANSDGDREGRNPEPFATPQLIAAAGLDDADSWCVSGSLVLSRVARLWEQTLETILKHHGLIPAEMRVLSALIARPGQQLTMGDIRRSVAVTAGGVTKAVSRLEALGLVTRRPGKADRRVMNVAVTRQGQARAREALRDVIASFDQAFGPCSAAEREAISRALQIMASGLPLDDQQ